MLKKLAIGLAAIVLLFVGFVFTQPDTFHVERTAVIDAPVEVVFGLVNTMEERRKWYPWERRDPDMERTYGEVKAGVGATYGWRSDEMGEGFQEIVESVENEKVVDRLVFLTPYESESTVAFAFAGEGDTTRVTWSMSGGGGFVARLMNVFVNMDDLLGSDYEEGLENLEEAARAVVADRAAAAEAEAEGDVAAAAEADEPEATGDADAG